MKRAFKYFMSWIRLLIGGSMIFGGVFASKTVDDIGVSLGVMNGFSGSVSFIDTYYSDTTTLYTADSVVPISVSASVTSTYDLNTGPSGSGTGNYSATEPGVLSGADGLYSFQASFVDTSKQRVLSNTIHIFKDTTPPSLPTVSVPESIDNILMSSIYFQWSESVDDASGFSHFEVRIGTNTSMIHAQSFTSTGTQLLVDKSLLPLGSLFFQVIAYDNVGNMIQTVPVKFVANPTNRTSSIPSSGSFPIPVVPESEHTNPSPLPTTDDPQPPTPLPVLEFSIYEQDDTSPKLPQEITTVIETTKPIDQKKPTDKNSPISTFNPNSVLSTIPQYTQGNSDSGIYSEVYLCSLRECVIVPGEILQEGSLQYLHYSASDSVFSSSESFILYNSLRQQRKFSAILFLILSLTCYDIELHLNRLRKFYNE